MTNQPSKRPAGRPKGSGNMVNLLRSLNVGDSIVVPLVMNEAAMLQVARNRFYNPAKRLGIKVEFTIINGDNVVIRRKG